MNATFQTACVIDDDPIFVFAAGKQMELRRFSENVISFKNGKDAFDGLKRILEHNAAFPEVILLDINMPVMNGWELLDALKQVELPSCRLYVVSSSINPEDMSRAESYSIVSGFISKPLPPEVLDEIAGGLR